MEGGLNSRRTVGVLGAGSFGTALANLLAHNSDVLLYSRNQPVVDQINSTHRNLGHRLSPKIVATTDLEMIAQTCRLLLPVVPSENFRELIQNISPYLQPYHLMIHGTKGLDIKNRSLDGLKDGELRRADVYTMSEVIRDETVVLRVGCLSGPNLAQEILMGQPTATVIGSHFQEVIEAGKKALSSANFHVFGTNDLTGAELAGALKNIIAIASGILGGIGLGKNIQAMLITRGLVEMVHFGKAMGATSEAFFGTAGIGDLVATATSADSRNYTFGYRLGKGEAYSAIQQSMPELAEGVRTLQIILKLSNYYRLHVPLSTMLYKVIFENYDIQKALEFLVRYPYDIDVDFFGPESRND
jgi:glycerol-3-phosphate dehydrogenase (NAD(P)+)